MLAALTDTEHASAVVYLDDRVIGPPETLQLDGRDVAISSPSVVAFVDQEPGVNWGHRCRYLIMALDTEDEISVEATMPPFLRSMPPTLRVLYQAESVPDWAVAHP